MMKVLAMKYAKRRGYAQALYAIFLRFVDHHEGESSIALKKDRASRDLSAISRTSTIGIVRAISMQAILQHKDSTPGGNWKFQAPRCMPAETAGSTTVSSTGPGAELILKLPAPSMSIKLCDEVKLELPMSSARGHASTVLPARTNQRCCGALSGLLSTFRDVC